MPSPSRLSLFFVPLLFTALVPTADASGAAAGRVHTQAASPATMSPQARGEYARRFVKTWGAHAERTEGVAVAVWARRLVPSFLAADPARLRLALQQDTYEAALATLTGRNARSTHRATSKALGDTARDLVYTPVQPCRILDTRTGGGPIAAESTRDFRAVHAASTGGDYTAQGGSNTDCGMGATSASAVVINLTVVQPGGAGFATVFTAFTGRPLAASVNYTAGAIVNNSVTVQIPNPTTTADFSIYSYAQSHYVADIVGYYSRPQGTGLDCVSLQSSPITIPANSIGNVSGPACGQGYTAAGVECEGEPTAGLRLITLGGNFSEERRCTWSNTNNQGKQAWVYTTCCRVPGR